MLPPPVTPGPAVASAPNLEPCHNMQVTFSLNVSVFEGDGCLPACLPALPTWKLSIVGDLFGWDAVNTYTATSKQGLAIYSTAAKHGKSLILTSVDRDGAHRKDGTGSDCDVVRSVHNLHALSSHLRRWGRKKKVVYSSLYRCQVSVVRGDLSHAFF